MLEDNGGEGRGWKRDGSEVAVSRWFERKRKKKRKRTRATIAGDKGALGVNSRRAIFLIPFPALELGHGFLADPAAGHARKKRHDIGWPNGGANSPWYTPPWEKERRNFPVLRRTTTERRTRPCAVRNESIGRGDIRVARSFSPRKIYCKFRFRSNFMISVLIKAQTRILTTAERRIEVS